MIQTLLICLGLWLTPFVYSAKSLREPKELACLGVCLALGLLTAYYGHFKKFSNIWIIALIGWFLINILEQPSVPVKYFNTLAPNFWTWKPFLFGTVYCFAIMAIGSMGIDPYRWEFIKNSIIYPAFLTSIYIFIQYFNLDQFFGPIESLKTIVTESSLAGFIGQPTLVSPFVAMCVPLTIKEKKYWQAAVMVGAVLITKSLVAISALGISLLFFVGMVRKRRFWCVFLIPVLLIIAFFAYPNKAALKDMVYRESSGRFVEWSRIYRDWNSFTLNKQRKFTVTGVGAGSFSYIYPIKHKTTFRQVHNEYLEILYNFGIGGLVLFLLAGRRAVIGCFKSVCNNDMVLAVFSGALCISICAAGTFIWQLGATAFYSVVFVGLLHNKTFLGGGR